RPYLVSRDLGAVPARDLRQMLVVAIGRGDPVAAGKLEPILARDLGLDGRGRGDGRREREPQRGKSNEGHFRHDISPRNQPAGRMILSTRWDCSRCDTSEAASSPTPHGTPYSGAWHHPLRNRALRRDHGPLVAAPA